MMKVIECFGTITDKSYYALKVYAPGSYDGLTFRLSCREYERHENQASNMYTVMKDIADKYNIGHEGKD